MDTKFFSWEGKTYRIEDSGKGLSASVERDGKFEAVDGRLVATIMFEGTPVEPSPVKARGTACLFKVGYE